jgi:hypothetical protein
MTRAAERIAEAEKAKAEKARQDADRAKAAQDARDICHTAATGASADHLAYVAVNR